MVLKTLKSLVNSSKYQGFTINFGIIRLNFAGGSR